MKFAMGPDEYYDDCKPGGRFDSMETWSVAMFRLAMKFAQDYADHWELVLRNRYYFQEKEEEVRNTETMNRALDIVERDGL